MSGFWALTTLGEQGLEGKSLIERYWATLIQFEKSRLIGLRFPLSVYLDEKQTILLLVDSASLKHLENKRFSLYHAHLSVYNRNPVPSGKAFHNIF